MEQLDLYKQISSRFSRMTTRSYSTSFTLGIWCLDKEFRDPVYSVYGFVRFADEIVDTFHGHDRALLLHRFTEDTWRAIDEKISINPILQSFQATVNAFNIDRSLIEQFLQSMEMDLHRSEHDEASFGQYILGSAEVVGLMCLRVFCKGNEETYHRLKTDAMKLGSAFQKINFLRDLRADYTILGRCYFPGLDINRFDEETKKKIEENIASDFRQGFEGIKRLPRGARLGVYVAYLYYIALFRKIKQLPSEAVLQSRVRVRNRFKLAILGYSFVKHQLNLL